MCEYIKIDQDPRSKEKLGASVHLKGGRHWMEAKSTSVVGGFISIELKSNQIKNRSNQNQPEESPAVAAEENKWTKTQDKSSKRRKQDRPRQLQRGQPKTAKTSSTLNSNS